MSKKPVIGESLAASLSDAAETKPPLKAKKLTANKAVVGMTFYIPKATHRRMKQMAMDRETSLQKLVEEAVDMWLAANSELPFRETHE
ncbi:MAG: ribbon-helix-helix domain-containing protein [Rhodomicrobium sp.]